MKNLLKLISLAGLLLTLVPSIMYFYQDITFSVHKLLMAMGTVLWFVSAPFWMNKES